MYRNGRSCKMVKNYAGLLLSQNMSSQHGYCCQLGRRRRELRLVFFIHAVDKITSVTYIFENRGFVQLSRHQLDRGGMNIIFEIRRVIFEISPDPPI
jgi:hypothetical protein